MNKEDFTMNMGNLSLLLAQTSALFETYLVVVHVHTIKVSQLI